MQIVCGAKYYLAFENLFLEHIYPSSTVDGLFINIWNFNPSPKMLKDSCILRLKIAKVWN